jgi:hypothetical protein
MKRLSARLRGDPGRTLPLGNQTPVAEWRTGNVAELRIGLDLHPLLKGFRDVDGAEHNAVLSGMW